MTNRNPRRAAIVGSVVTVLLAGAVTTAVRAGTANADALSARNLPANGQVLFVMGQDSDTLADYSNAVLSNPSLGAPTPGGVTLYTNIVYPPPGDAAAGPLAGMNGTANWGSGNTNFDQTLAAYPNSALSVGLYLSDGTFSSAACGNQPLRAIIGRNDADVTAGSPNLISQYRAKVDELITKLKSYNRNVFLRIGYEFDGPWNCYNSDFYVQAFRYIKGRIDALGATRLATVWQSAGWPLNTSTDHPEYNYIVTDPNHLNPWYPGDAYVDWVGLSSFYNAGSVATQWGCASYDLDPVTAQQRVLDFARSHAKPVMIAESSPQGYTTGALTKSCIMRNQPAATSAQTIWNEWYAGYFNLIESNQDIIRAAAYINTWWDNQPQWVCAAGAQAGGTGCGNGYWGDSRVQANPTILNQFLTELRKPIFVNGTGTPPPATTGPASPTPTRTASPTPTPTTGGGTASFSQGATASQLWFQPNGFTATFVVVHYSVNGGGQLNYQLSWNAGTGRWEQPVTVPAGGTVTYSFDYQPSTQGYQVSTATYSWTNGGGTGTPTPTPTTGGAFSQGVSAIGFWFAPAATATFVVVHYSVNGGSQLNYQLTWNAGTGRWERPASFTSGNRVSYWYDYQPASQTYQVSSPTYSWTCC